MPCPTYSFEFFPARTESGEKAFWQALPQMAALDPAFMTVTSTSGGDVRESTVKTALEIQKRTNIPTAVHLTYINNTRKDVYALADHLWEGGIRHVVALRGDLPANLHWPLDKDPHYFQYTSHFVAALKARHDFEVSVGCYPEKHPDAPTFQSDIDALMKKCDAGADRAITQFFFDNAIFYKFLEACAKAHIKTPIQPGLLPVHDLAKAISFAKKCESSIPSWLIERFEGRDAQDSLQIAQEVLTEQVRDLTAHGIKHIHFYTLNKSELTVQACEALHASEML